MSDPRMSLAQEMRQKQIMAPQLRQSLELLQAPAMDLQALIRLEIEKNPALSEAGLTESKDDTHEIDAQMDAAQDSDTGQSSNPDTEPDKDFEAYLFGTDDMPYTQDTYGRDEDAEKRREYFFESQRRDQSLQAYLLGQLSYAEPDDRTRAIGEQIIGGIDSDGYMKTPLADVAQALAVPLEDCERVLHLVQGFDPPGIGARTVGECLLLQLEQQGEENSLAAKIARDHLDLVGRGSLARVAKLCEVTEDEVSAAIKRLSELNPKPGLAYGEFCPQYVIPEIEVHESDGRYKAFTDEKEIPLPRISKKYLRMLKDPSTAPDVREYVREKIAAAAAFIRGLENRQSTLQRVSEAIVDRQQDFFKLGPTALKPMTMLEVASELGLHETTVSRAVSGKYMRSPRGITELRAFFTTGVAGGDSGSNVSNAAVKAAIGTIVNGEDPSKPFTDSDLRRLLEEKFGMSIARRTVAKYREAANILPSHLRRGR